MTTLADKHKKKQEWSLLKLCTLIKTLIGTVPPDCDYKDLFLERDHKYFSFFVLMRYNYIGSN
jgi:hypothetical protein